MTEEASGADAPEVDDSSEGEATNASEEVARLTEALERAQKAEKKAQEAIQTRQKTKETNRSLSSENEELRRKVEAFERSKLEGEGKYHEALSRVEKEREEMLAAQSAVFSKVAQQLKDKQFEDLYSKVVEKDSLSHDDRFVIETALRRIADSELLLSEPKIESLEDIENIVFQKAKSTSVDTASRHLRKLAPSLYKNTKDGGDVSRPSEESNTNGVPIPPGMDAKDPRVAAVIKAAKGNH